MLASLHNIWIYNCPSLVSFPQGGLPTLRLKSLIVDDCEKLEVLFEKIECPVFLKFAREGQVLSHIRKWEKMLTRIQAVLEDAEEKQMSNRLVKMWLDDLKDLAYDVEDILDEFATESLQRKLKGEPQPQAGANKLRKLLHSAVNAINPGSYMFNSTI
ncbi:hypothetical protein GH714_004214 [Hevea brasiliensis]|uniref:Disease resistance N-terminal domain-containing protein n=1 Tax=Hevea brasiliensis TaxID=3981 RepID=A0A6A6KXG7_HEVBR|nr:hypothetical protein GH714_004214 [Hevea brasiliensis]